MRKIILLLFLSMIFSAAAQSQNKLPQFKDYPVKRIYKGKNAPAKISTASEKMFRTRLRDAAREKPNFAGRYVMTAWGCGTECLSGAVVDVKTGKVSFWGFSLCCWGADTDEKFEPIEFRLNSNLVVFSGNRGEQENDNGAHFYKFENGRFVHLKTVPKKDSN